LTKNSDFHIMDSKEVIRNDMRNERVRHDKSRSKKSGQEGSAKKSGQSQKVR